MGKTDLLAVGGQAVIEGVMMRSPEYVSVAVRKPGGNILVKRNRFISWTRRIRFLGFPFVRGGVVLIESLVLGVGALTFSGDAAMVETGKAAKTKTKAKAKTKGSAALLLTAVAALGFGIALFFLLPLWLTEWMGVENGIMFNLVDTGLRLAIFLVYLFLISRWKEIQRVFQYHGAEHKSIFTYEKHEPLTLEHARPHSTHHPRCGTSFLFVVICVALVVFTPFGKPDSALERLVRFCMIPVIGGISYEIIRLSGNARTRGLARVLTAPGLWFQKITTREPDDTQLEVALVALKSALDLDVGPDVEKDPASV
jgi:uncharacterized protein YqhQ